MKRADLKQIIERSDTRVGRGFDLTVQAIIVLSLVAFSIETLPDLSDASRGWLRVFEICVVMMFTAEYVLRLVVADQKLKFVTSFFGLVDLVSILPFYLALGVDLRSLRACRLLRVFRVLKLARYSAAMRRFHVAFLLAREELILFGGAAGVVLFLAAVGIYHFESPAQPESFGSVFHSLWWAVCTLTTVGYGDVYPVTVGGRMFTFVVLLVGLGVVAVPAGLVSAALSEARRLEADRAGPRRGGERPLRGEDK